jgi:2-polyprenyl-6-hydroxyphenyl methylase/3-demethylubiquinone-9 3-methyltransferase
MGDYATFATELMWELGPILVDAAKIGPGQRVLDVAAGTGNAAIRAAQRGAEVVASDLTPEHFEAGHAQARALGVDLDWAEADAEALPFDESSFDVVMSLVGAIFAPRHQRVADEMVRVCKPGGRIAMANFAADGLITDFFGAFGPFMPPPRPGDLPPHLWGDETHLRQLFGNRLSDLTLERRSYVERAETPRAYCEFFKRTFGPVTALYASLEDDPERAAALDEAFLDFATKSNSGPEGGPAEYRYDYVVVTGTKKPD